MTPEQKSGLIKGLVVLAALALLVAGYFYFFKPEKDGAVNTAKNAGESIPQISTNAGENVPEINPLDRANPFKYTNPLR